MDNDVRGYLGGIVKSLRRTPSEEVLESIRGDRGPVATVATQTTPRVQTLPGEAQAGFQRLKRDPVAPLCSEKDVIRGPDSTGAIRLVRRTAVGAGHDRTWS